MVLINVHPDYVNFSERKNASEEFSKSKYVGLLNYIDSKYKGKYWNPLPKELATYLENHFPQNSVNQYSR